MYRLTRVAAASVVALAAVTIGAGPARAATVDHYRVELKAWIPFASVDGPPPSAASPLCQYGPVAQYNGNDHVGYDGSHKVLVTYDFTYSDGVWADVDVAVDYDETRASYGLCSRTGHASSDGGVEATDEGVRMYIDSANPLVIGSPSIESSLDLSFTSADELAVRHRMHKFPSHGFRVWRNDALVATAVDFDASCKNVTGLPGLVAIGKGLRDKATSIQHHIDVRAVGQDYFGPCGQDRPEPFGFPAA